MSATHNHRHPPHDESGQDHPGTHHGHDDVQGTVLNLDAEVMAEHIAAATSWLPVRRVPIEIVDLGAGTGAGTFALLSQFPEARVTAVDSSATHLDELRSKARAANLGDRVGILLADLNASEWPDLGVPDLVWASASMHHLADPVRALRNVREILAPGGLIAIIELAGLPRFSAPHGTRGPARPGEALPRRYPAAPCRADAAPRRRLGTDAGRRRLHCPGQSGHQRGNQELVEQSGGPLRPRRSSGRPGCGGRRDLSGRPRRVGSAPRSHQCAQHPASS